MEAQNYLENVAAPMLARLKVEPLSIELQISATIIVFHACDYVAETAGQSLTKVRKEVEALEPSFELVYAAAIANKHDVVRRDPTGHIGLRDPQKILPNTLTFNGEPITFNGEEVTFGEEPYFVMPNGEEAPLIETLERVLVAICSQL